MDKQPILEAITHIKSLQDLSAWDLQTILADYPFFQTAHLLWAKKSMDTDHYEHQEIVQKAAIYAGNRAVLYKLLYQQEEALQSSPDLDDATLQMDKKDLPFIITEKEADGQETEVVSIEHLELISEDKDNQETEVVSIEHLDLPEEEEIIDKLDFLENEVSDIPNDDTEGIEIDKVAVVTDKEKTQTEELTIIEKLKEEIAAKQKSIELQWDEEDTFVSNEVIEDPEEPAENIPASPTAIDEKLEDTARSITSALDKSLLKIAQEDVVEVESHQQMPIVPASVEEVKEDEKDDKFALKHIFEKDTEDEDNILNTEQISEEARKQVEQALSSKLKTLDGEEKEAPPIVESGNTMDMTDLIQKEVQQIIQRDMEQLQEEADEDLWDENMKVNSSIIRASIAEDKEALKQSLLEENNDNVFIDDDEDETEEEDNNNETHPENEIESDLIMSLKAKVESYKQKKKTFESWLTGDLEKEELPKVKLSKEDETEIKKFVDFQSEVNANENTSSKLNAEDIPLEGTESMAEIYAQQGYYKRAVKIYEQLSLKYPEKSSYFAGKIVELQKKL
ncbi:MAG: hypothetical protein R3E32_21515 [Chitinophagales bacterium]